MQQDTIFQSVLIVFAKYCENWTIFEKTIAPQLWHIFNVSQG